MSRLNDLYKGEIRKSLREKFGYTNEMEIPKLEKIVINIGVGEATENSKAVDAAASDLAAITGQKPLICKAHRSLLHFPVSAIFVVSAHRALTAAAIMLSVLKNS